MVTLMNDPKRTTKAISGNSPEAEAICQRVGEAVRKALFTDKPGDKTGAFHVDAILRRLGLLSAFVTTGLFVQKGQPTKSHFWNVVTLKTVFYLDVAPDVVFEKPPAETLWLVPAEAQRMGYWVGRQGRFFYDEKSLDMTLVERVLQEIP
jgi:hypothetical protein